jgi:shikimate kinase
MRVFLIGYMGVGKTTLGKKLASRLLLKFIDLDIYIESKEGAHITQIIENKGEKHFRVLERKYLEEVCDLENVLISTGGGTPCFFQNMTLINDNGRSIFLNLNEKTLLKRLLNSRASRPLLNGKNENELESFIHTHLTHRLPYYNQAHITFDVMHLNAERMDELVEKILM